jgi:hypothetical protein
LSVLDNVDKELMCVDEWLGTQIQYLSGVQRELFQIEDENSALETSWHNLSAVKTMITSLLEGPLSLRPEHEAVLRAPISVVHAALEDKDLLNTASILQPLVKALESLRTGLDAINGKNSFDSGQWKRLQTMSAVSHQRQKLVELTELVCHQLIDFVGSLFKNLLQHKAITKDVKHEGSDPARCVVVRKFSFSSFTNKVKEQQGRFLVESEDQPASTPTDQREHLKHSNSVNEYVGLKNQVQSAQSTFHGVVAPYIPLLQHLSALSPSLAETILSTYTSASTTFLFQPLFKEMFTELFASIPHRQNPVFTFASAPKSLARKRTNPSLRFQHPSLCRPGAVLVVSPWTVLAVAVSMLEDVIMREDEFTTQIMRCVGQFQQNTSNHDAVEARAASITKQFAPFKEKVMRLVTVSDYADGIEIVAMMATVDMLITNHQQCMLEKHVASTSTADVDERKGRVPTDVPLDIIGSLLESARNVLQSRVSEFLTSQVAWIKHSHEETKRSTVLLPIVKFPAFIDQLKEFAGDKVCRIV